MSSTGGFYTTLSESDLKYNCWHKIQTTSLEHSHFEKLIADQLVKKFSAFYGRNPWVHCRVLKSPPLVRMSSDLNPVYAFTLYFFQDPRQRLSLNWFFPSGFPTKTLYAILISNIHTACPAYLILLDGITLVISGDEYKL
jgi:hypothetical protein